MLLRGSVVEGGCCCVMVLFFLGFINSFALAALKHLTSRST